MPIPGNRVQAGAYLVESNEHKLDGKKSLLLTSRLGIDTLKGFVIEKVNALAP
jgi:hypothetical protein